MQFRLLGPLEVRDGGGVVIPIAGHQSRTLLCVLLLDAGRVVSTERLIDALWGESPPSAAVHGLHVQASKLRAALRNGEGDAVQISTEAGGYRLQLDGHQLDVARLEQLVAEGRRELATDRAAAAVSTLRAAESLWRGEPLADFANAAFAQPAITKMDELRRTVVSTRIEAQLAAGEAVAVVPEVEALAAADPLREQLRGLQMRALYQTGQQARALEVYRETRERLADELGVDPSPELQHLMQAILAHDPALQGPANVQSVPTGAAAATVAPGGSLPESSAGRPARVADRLRRPGRRWALAAGVAVLAAGAVTGIVAARGNGGGVHAKLQADVVSEYDSAGHLRGQFPVGKSPSSITAGAGSLWVTNQDDNTVTRIDLKTGRPAVIGDVGDAPAGIAFGAGSAWVVSPTNVAHGATATGTITPVNIDSNAGTGPIKAGQAAAGVAYGDGSVWVAATGEARIYRLDPAHSQSATPIDVGTAPTGIAVTPQAVWVTNAGDDTVSKLDPVDGTPLSKPVQVGVDPTAIVVGAGGVWVANHLDRSVSRINPVTGQVLATIPVGDGPSGIAIADDAVWVTTDQAGALVRIDPATNRTRTIPVPGAPRAVAVAGGHLYVASAASYQGHSGGTLRVLVAGRPPPGTAWPVIDPTSNDDLVTSLVGAATTDTLVGYARTSGPASNSLVPDLVEALPTPTPDMTSYPFTLRSGIRFSTGQPLRATDVRASFERAMLEVGLGDLDTTPLAAIKGASACLTPRAAHCDLSDGITINDADRTVRFQLTHPEPGFLSALTFLEATIVPAGTPVLHPSDMTHHPVVPGTGPYRVSKFVWPKRVVLTRNPYFHQWSQAAQPDGYANSIIIDTPTTTAQNLTDLEHGKFDVLDNQALTPGQVQQAVTGHPVVKRDEGGVGYRFAFLNEKLPPFNNRKARQALNYAIDRQALIRLRDSAQLLTPTCQIITPGTTGYRPYCPYTINPNDSGTWTAPDMARAQQLVRESGTRGDRVLLWQIPKDKAHLEASTTYFAQVLSQLGYQVTLRPRDANFGDYLAGIFKGHAQIGMIGYGSTPDGGDQVQPWTCSYDDPARYCNRRVDALYRHGVAMELTDPARARRIWSQVDKMLVDDAALVPVWSESFFALVSTRVGNWSTNIAAGILLAQLWVR